MKRGTYTSLFRMSLITEYQDSNDRRKDLNPPPIKVAQLPPTTALTPAPMPPEMSGVTPSFVPDVQTPPMPIEAPPVAPQAPENGDVVVDTLAPQPTPEELNQGVLDGALGTDITSLQKRSDTPGVSSFDVNTMGESNPNQQVSDAELEEQLRIRGEHLQSGEDTEENLSGFIPTLYNGDGLPYFDAVNSQADAGRDSLRNNLIQERAEMVERGFQPQTIPQLGTDPTKPRPDSTKPFYQDFVQWLGNATTPGEFKPFAGKFGQAGNGLVGGLLYTLGVPQNILYGAGADIENVVQRSPLGGAYDQVGKLARGGANTVLGAVGAGLNAINTNIFGMGKVDLKLPDDFDPVQADPKFKGSYTLNAVRGAQYSFSDYQTNNNPVGLRRDGNNPSFLGGLAMDVLLDPAGAAVAALAPLKKGNRLVRTAGKVAEVAVDPISEGVVPLLGRVSSASGIFKPKALPPASDIPNAKPPKKGGKKKASQAGVAPQASTPKAPPKGSPLRAAWEQRQAARKARAADTTKRVIVPEPPTGTYVHPDKPVTPPTLEYAFQQRQAARREKAALNNRVLVAPAGEHTGTSTPKVSILRNDGSSETRAVAKPSVATQVVAQQEPKVALEVVTPREEGYAELLIQRKQARQEVDRLDDLVTAGETEAKVARNTKEVARLEEMTEGIKPALPPATRRTNATPGVTNDVLVTPPPSAAEVLVTKEIEEVRLLEVDEVGTVVDAVEARKVAEQVVRKEEAELLRLADQPTRAERIQNSLKPKSLEQAQAEARKIEQDYADYARETGEENMLQPVKYREQTAVDKPRAAMSRNELIQDSLRPKDDGRIIAQTQKAAEARVVAESIPPVPAQSEIPTVSASVFQGEMTVAEVAEAIATFVPGTQVDAALVKPVKRSTAQLTELMKLIPHPTSGKPLVAASKQDFRTYPAIQQYLVKQGIEDPLYFRMLGREGAAIPDELFKAPAFRVITAKAKPFTATPSKVVDPTVTRVVAGQIEKPGVLPGVSLDRSVKVSYDPSLIQIPKGSKVKDFRGKLVQQRNKLRQALDEVDSPEEMEEILKGISDIDDELSTPNLKQHPSHLKQLQEEVIPDTEHGTSNPVIELTEKKIRLEAEVADVSDEVRALSGQLEQQEELLESSLAETLNTADVGRRELADNYTPTIPDNGVTDSMFSNPTDVSKTVAGNSTIFYASDISGEVEELARFQKLVTRAQDNIVVPGGVDVVIMTDKMIDSLDFEHRVKALANYDKKFELGDVGGWSSRDKNTIFIKASAVKSVDDAELFRIIAHEMGHRVHFNKESVTPGYVQAIQKDGGKYISGYSKKTAETLGVARGTAEDFADSVEYYVRDKYQFETQAPARARVLAEQLETSAAEALNSQVFYKGTRTPNWIPSDPLTNEARDVWGQATYLHVDPERAAQDAQAELAANTPGLMMRDVDVAGTVYQVKPNFGRVLRANDKVSPSSQRFFADAMEDVLGRKTPEARKALRHFISVTSPKVLEDASTKYPRYVVKEMYGLVEKYAVKYLGVLPEETLSDLTRAINLKMREAGYDAIYDNDTVAVLNDRVTAINREVLSEADTTDVLVARYNADSATASANPSSPSAQINHMESSVRLQQEMVENTKRRLSEAQNEQLNKLNEWQRTKDELEDLAKAEQDEKRLMKQRESEALEAAETERLSKPRNNPCEF